MTASTKTATERATQLAQAIEAEQSATVTTRAEIAGAIEATQALQDQKQEGDIALLQKINSRSFYLAELRHQIEQLEQENEGHRMSVVSAIRANINSRASSDADALLLGAFNLKDLSK
jgi:hypothetical protein